MEYTNKKYKNPIKIDIIQKQKCTFFAFLYMKIM